MLQRQVAALQDFILNYGCIIPGLSDYVERIDAAVEKNGIPALVEIYDQLYPLLEQQIWSSDNFDEAINFYHALFREQEGLTRLCEDEDRYDFILTIPLTDQPEHVKNCLESIYQQCVIFAYGGRTDGVFNRIQVVLAEDTQDPENHLVHQELAEQYTEKGLRVHYCSLAEQYRLFLKIPREQRIQLSTLLSERPKSRFYNKGDIATRNLSLLKCLKLTGNPDRTLYFMIDDDQVFRVNRKTIDGYREVIAINYFYYINRIFLNNNIHVLTSDVLGDPPLSPTVMMVNWLDDVLNLYEQLAKVQPDHACEFHSLPVPVLSLAASHDMPELLGFEPGLQHYSYRCPIKHSHNNMACFTEVSSRLQSFFCGAHLTRKIDFEYNGSFAKTSAAKGLNTGNFVVNNQGLKHGLQFAHLHLASTGYSAGCLLQAEIAEAFASVNLPMLRQRHIASDSTGLSTCNSDTAGTLIDMSDEILQQFFGDLMFVTVDALTDSDLIQKRFDMAQVSMVLEQAESQLLEKYQQQHRQIIEKNNQLKSLINDTHQWWHSHERAIQSIAEIRRVIQTVEFNFKVDAVAWKVLNNGSERSQYKRQITEALLQYHEASELWNQIMSE